MWSHCPADDECVDDEHFDQRSGQTSIGDQNYSHLQCQLTQIHTPNGSNIRSGNGPHAPLQPSAVQCTAVNRCDRQATGHPNYVGQEGWEPLPFLSTADVAMLRLVSTSHVALVAKLVRDACCEDHCSTGNAPSG